VCEPGDSGGPVYRLREERKLIGLVVGNYGVGRANVPTDVFVPLAGPQRIWVMAQMRRQAAEKAPKFVRK
jgi:hypothetical protein